MRTIPHADFLAELDAQGVPRVHAALKCCSCGQIQSVASLMEFAGLARDDAADCVAQECGGRHRPGCGCDWATYGLLRIHTLEVVTEGGNTIAAFAPATPEEALALMAKVVAHNQAKGA